MTGLISNLTVLWVIYMTQIHSQPDRHGKLGTDSSTPVYLCVISFTKGYTVPPVCCLYSSSCLLKVNKYFCSFNVMSVQSQSRGFECKGKGWDCSGRCVYLMTETGELYETWQCFKFMMKMHTMYHVWLPWDVQT